VTWPAYRQIGWAKSAIHQLVFDNPNPNSAMLGSVMAPQKNTAIAFALLPGGQLDPSAFATALCRARVSWARRVARSIPTPTRMRSFFVDHVNFYLCALQRLRNKKVGLARSGVREREQPQGRPVFILLTSKAPRPARGKKQRMAASDIGLGIEF